MKSEYIFAVRDTDTGKLVSNITHPGRKFWIREQSCDCAISDAIHFRTVRPGQLKKVKFKLVEVEEINA